MSLNFKNMKDLSEIYDGTNYKLIVNNNGSLAKYELDTSNVKTPYYASIEENLSSSLNGASSTIKNPNETAQAIIDGRPIYVNYGSNDIVTGALGAIKLTQPSISSCSYAMIKVVNAYNLVIIPYNRALSRYYTMINGQITDSSIIANWPYTIVNLASTSRGDIYFVGNSTWTAYVNDKYFNHSTADIQLKISNNKVVTTDDAYTVLIPNGTTIADAVSPNATITPYDGTTSTEYVLFANS